MKIPPSKYGRKNRSAKTFWIDDPLRPVLKRIAAKEKSLSENDVINHALYQLKEVQDDLNKHTHEETINQTSTRSAASAQASQSVTHIEVADEHA